MLLVYANPSVGTYPVSPMGLERIAHAFEQQGCQTRLSCPFLHTDPTAALEAALRPLPDLVGLSIRNIDDAQVVTRTEGASDLDTTFHLDSVRPLVQTALRAVGSERVLVGGSALPQEARSILEYLGAPIGIVGPAEDLCARIGKSLHSGGSPALPDDPRLIRVERTKREHWRAGAQGTPLPGSAPRDPVFLQRCRDLELFVPILLSSGCDRRCHYCIEARVTGRAVVPRPVEQVVAEVQTLREQGLSRFWLVASELNVPTAHHTTRVLRELNDMGLDLQGFFQAAPVPDSLLDAMEDAGMDPETVNFELGHLDESILRSGGGPTNRRQIDELVETYHRRGYRTLCASVLFGSHPHETEDTLEGALRDIRSIDQSFPLGLELGYACGARVYP
ncbi:MAG: radical SAM protein, partial [Myxococcota bacterium]|nr:radical SAM protein [Myxococcota bacterium]